MRLQFFCTDSELLDLLKVINCRIFARKPGHLLELKSFEAAMEHYQIYLTEFTGYVPEKVDDFSPADFSMLQLTKPKDKECTTYLKEVAGKVPKELKGSFQEQSMKKLLGRIKAIVKKTMLIGVRGRNVLSPASAGTLFSDLYVSHQCLIAHMSMKQDGSKNIEFYR